MGFFFGGVGGGVSFNQDDEITDRVNDIILLRLECPKIRQDDELTDCANDLILIRVECPKTHAIIQPADRRFRPTCSTHTHTTTHTHTHTHTHTRTHTHTSTADRESLDKALMGENLD